MRLPIIGDRQMATLLDALRLAADFREDEADRLDAHGFTAEATEQRAEAKRTRLLLTKFGAA